MYASFSWPAHLVASIERRRIALAVSGGPDSLALAALARQVYPRERLIALVVDHNLTSMGVTEDSVRTGSLLEKLDIEHEVIKMDWSDMALGELKKGKLQQEARERRYRLLLGGCLRHNAQLLLTGHHGDDDVVTMFYRMSHASGLEGLAAMKLISPFPVSHQTADRHFIGHPLLSVSKGRLLETCKDWRLAWNEDRSNADSDYLRNEIVRALGTLQEQGVAKREELVEMLEMFKEVRRFIHEQIVQVFDRSVIINRINGDSTLVLNDEQWLRNRPIATRVIGTLVQYASAKHYPSRTLRLNEIYSNLLQSFVDYRETYKQWLAKLPPNARQSSLLPLDLTRRVKMAQQTVGGSTFYSLARMDAMRRISMQSRLENREIAYGPSFLIQREPPCRINSQAAGFNSASLSMEPGKWFLWDSRIYLMYLDQMAGPTAEPRTFQVSFMTPADVRDFELLTKENSAMRRRIYTVMGCTPGSHLYQIPVVREPSTGYMCFPTLQVDYPTNRYQWRTFNAGNSILSARFLCQP